MLWAMRIDIYTDGSCLGNPGPGGWAYSIEATPAIHKEAGGEPHTTNNRMELQAVIEALRACEHLQLNGPFVIHSDSSWVVKTMTDNWKRKKNLDLWEALMPLLPGKEIEWKWVRGHAGHPQNEDCDRRALKAAQEAAKLARTMDPKDLRLPDEVPSLF